MARFRSHHVKVGQRPVQPIVELFVCRKNLRFLGVCALARTGGLLNNLFVTRLDLDPRIAIHFTRDRPPVADVLAGLQAYLKARYGLT